jgi:low affinity Fe/Cu permease
LIARPVWQFAEKITRWSGHHWAWTGTILLVIGIAIWLGYEGWLVGWWPITYITAVQGVLILLLALLPNVRKFYQN